MANLLNGREVFVVKWSFQGICIRVSATWIRKITKKKGVKVNEVVSIKAGASSMEHTY